MEAAGVGCKYAGAAERLITGERVVFEDLIFPLGISFYSFKAVGYTADVCRGHIAAETSPVRFAAWFCMFPTVTAGPITSYGATSKELDGPDFGILRFNDGIRAFVTGLAFKVLLADRIYPLFFAVSTTGWDSVSTPLAWLSMIAYSLYIYFDFAGYSDMAIGLGRIMGFKFPENFDNPYTSRSITEFWRRWHMTLGAFIMNYLYIPLGGNRKGKGRTYLNLWLCFLLSGLWHGASWNFVIWGALHGLFICADKLFLGKVMKKIGTVPSVILTFITVTVIWVFFRIENFTMAWTFVTRLFAFDFGGFALDGNAHFYTILVVALLFSFITLTPFGKKALAAVYSTDYTDRQHIGVWIIAAIGFIFCVAALNATSFSPFIYFRF